MNPFKRKKNNDDIFFESEIQLPKSDESKKPHSPYVLTKEEIIGNANNHSTKEELSPLEKLKKRMLAYSQETSEQVTEAVKEPQSVETNENDDGFVPAFTVDVDSYFIETDDEDAVETEVEPDEEDSQLQLAFIDGIVGPYPGEEETIEIESEEQSQPEVSLFQTCMPFITEGNNGQLPEAEPLYVLEKVESILGIDIPEEDEAENEPANEGTIVFDALKPTIISDIDSIPKAPVVDATTEISFTKTMPVIINPENLEESREIDISSEIFSKPEEGKTLVGMPFVDEEDDFKPDIEFNSKEDARKVRLYLLKQRRKTFLALCISVFALIPLLILSLPAFSDSMNKSSTGINVFSVICALLCIVSSIDCFKSLPSLFNSRTESNVLFCFTIIFQSIGIFVALFNKLDSSISYYAAFLLAIITFFRNLFLFKKSLNLQNNFKLLNSRYEKQGMILIDDAPTTFAMAHRAIDGEALIAAPQKTAFVKDFMKNSTIDRDLEGKVRLVFAFSSAICLLCGIAVGVYHQNFISGLISFSNLSALFCPLILFGVNTMPLVSAAKKLSRIKAAVFSIKSARKIEAANAIAIDCNQLFPRGSVKLYKLNILSENNLEETIAIATAITETIDSPLFPIFKSAMDTNSTLSIPEADSIKYEDRLGITGWVGDSRVFIGNRALMLAHEIEVPDMQIDKDLLQDGYFPVYLARDGKACALLAVRYIPNETIAKELRKITNIGVTVLVDNCDQNLSEEMICDYFDLYADSVKVMSGSGVHMFENATAPADELNCGAILTSRGSSACSVMNACIKIKRSVTLLTIACILSIVIGVVLFSYKYFGSAAPFISGLDLIAYQLISFVATLVAYLFTKP